MLIDQESLTSINIIEMVHMPLWCTLASALSNKW